MDLISQCALRVAKVVWRPGIGGFAFTVVCKATFELQPEASPLAAVQEPVTEADVYTGDGRSLALASDLVPFKKRSEVLVVGHAHAPEGRPVPSLVARLAVGAIDKSIQVVGDRYVDRYGRLSEPAHFTRMPLVWERAAGGPDTSNPVGIPVDDTARVDSSGHAPTPNLLPAGPPLTRWGDIIQPAGFGPIAPMWPSRAAHLHRHVAWWIPSRWYEHPLTADIDIEYFNAAPPDQQCAPPFGEETLYLENLHPRFTRLSTRLASVTPAATVDYGSGGQPIPLRCDTLLIDADRGLATLVWRAYVLLDYLDRPGRVVITTPAAPGVVLPAWVRSVSDTEATLVPETSLSSTVLPFSGTSAEAPGSSPPPATDAATESMSASVAIEHTTQPILHGTASPTARPRRTRTLDTTFTLQASALPFLSSPYKRGEESALAREPPFRESASGLPFMPPPADEEGIEKTLVPSLAAPAAALPFDGSQFEGAPQPDPAPEISASGLPFIPPFDSEESDDPPTPRRRVSPGWQSSHLTDSPWAAGRGSLPRETQPPPAGLPAESAAPLFTSALSPANANETLPPPPLLGALATASGSSFEALSRTPFPARETDPPPEAPAAKAEPDVAFDAYPPERCGAIAARLACNEGSPGDILDAEDLDAARWKRVHDHWLDRIRDEATHSRKKLLSDYDGAYVSALEALRGPIALEDYARLAEAAERSAVTEVLAERGLPEGAWPHVHRVWIGRMVKDVRLGKQVRAAIDTLRGAV